jgi:hypothetical protein
VKFRITLLLNEYKSFTIIFFSNKKNNQHIFISKRCKVEQTDSIQANFLLETNGFSSHLKGLSILTFTHGLNTFRQLATRHLILFQIHL